MINTKCSFLVVVCLATAPFAHSQGPNIDLTNWGAVTAPVFGTSEKGAYSAAEFFAGPNKFGSYYAGVLPNGRIVKPAGTWADPHLGDGHRHQHADHRQ
jgi:hypothetical protein